MKTIAIVLIALLLFSFVALSGCTTQVSESTTDRGIFGTEKTTTTVGTGGVQTTTKTCPFWNPDC